MHACGLTVFSFGTRLIWICCRYVDLMTMCIQGPFLKFKSRLNQLVLCCASGKFEPEILHRQFLSLVSAWLQTVPPDDHSPSGIDQETQLTTSLSLRLSGVCYSIHGIPVFGKFSSHRSTHQRAFVACVDRCERAHSHYPNVAAEPVVAPLLLFRDALTWFGRDGDRFWRQCDGDGWSKLK